MPTADASRVEIAWSGVKFRLRLLRLFPAHDWWREQMANGWEAEVAGFLATNLQRGDVFFDIGASVGPYAIFASRLAGPTGRVVAFEPDPVAGELLHANLAENGCDKNVEVVAAAVCDHDGTARMMTVGSLGDTRTHLAPTGAAAELLVAAIRLERFCKRRRMRPSVVKIDVEGAEHLVLRGAGSSLDRTRAVVVEIHSWQLTNMGADEAAVRRELDRIGFTRVWQSDPVEGQTHHVFAVREDEARS